MAERLSLSSSWGVSEPVDLGRTKVNGKGGGVTVKADVAWEAGGHQKLDTEKGPLPEPALSPRCS